MTPTTLKKITKTTSQADIAALTGLSESTISRYISGELSIPKKFEISLKNALALRKKEE